MADAGFHEIDSLESVTLVVDNFVWQTDALFEKRTNPGNKLDCFILHKIEITIHVFVDGHGERFLQIDRQVLDKVVD